MHLTCSSINTTFVNIHFHPYLLDTTTHITIMPRRQQHHVLEIV